MKTAIIISILAIILAFLEDQKVFKYGLLSSILIITVFVGIRYGWGTDMPTYQLNYQYYAESGLKLSDFAGLSEIRSGRSLELGWAILNVLCKPIGFFGMVILLAIVENIIIFDFIKRNVDKGYYWLAIYIYTMNPYLMVLGCSMMRQWLAMCIILFATRYIINGRFWIYFLFVILAASFHTSALLFLSLYLFRKLGGIRLNNSYIITIGIGVVIWLFIGIFFAREGAVVVLQSDAFEGYSNELESQETGSFGLGMIFKIIFYLFCVIQSRFLTKDKAILCWSLLMFVLLLPYTMSVHLASRLIFYIDAIAIASVPIAMKATKTMIVKLALIGFFALWNYVLYTGFFSSGYKWAYSTYHTILEAPVWQ